MKENWTDKSSFKFGDIVIAKRQWENLEEGHTHSPHIVIANDGEYIYALTGTTKKPYKHNSRKFLYTKIRNKESYYLLSIYKFSYDEINIKIGSISSKTENYLKRKLDSQIGTVINTEKKQFLDFIDKEDFATGDIIKLIKDNGEMKSGKYVIVSETNDGYQILEIIQDPDENNNNTPYYIVQYDVIHQISKSEKMYRVDCLDMEETQELLTNVKSKNLSTNTDKIAPRKIVRINNEDYLVYETSSSKATLYPISTTINYDASFIRGDLRIHVNFSRMLTIDLRQFDGEILSTIALKEYFVVKHKYEEYKNHKAIKDKHNDKARIFKDPSIKHQHLLLNKNRTQITILDLTDYYNGQITIRREHMRFLISSPCGYIGIPDYNNILCDINSTLKKEYNLSLPKYSNVRTKKDSKKKKKGQL